MGRALIPRRGILRVGAYLPTYLPTYLFFYIVPVLWLIHTWVDAPALDHLNSFPVTVKDGSVYITATPEKLKAGRRRPEISCTPASTCKDHVVIVGGYAPFSLHFPLI